MSGMLYVGNLPATASKEDLQQKFGQFGRVLSVEILTDPATSSRGHRSAHVEMGTSEEAQAAINRLNMTQYDNLVICVNRVRLKHRA